jgi:hypothetical protein
MASLKAIVLRGPDRAVDRVERWRVVDLCRVVEERWGVVYSETGMLRLLWSLDLSHRKTRPVHPQTSSPKPAASAPSAPTLGFKRSELIRSVLESANPRIRESANPRIRWPGCARSPPFGSPWVNESCRPSTVIRGCTNGRPELPRSGPNEIRSNRALPM